MTEFVFSGAHAVQQRKREGEGEEERGREREKERGERDREREAAHSLKSFVAASLASHSIVGAGQCSDPSIRKVCVPRLTAACKCIPGDT